VLEENFLGKNLGGFEARAVGAGAVDGDVEFAQAVGETEGKRNLGADDDKGDALALDEGNEAGDVVGGDGETRNLVSDAGVAGRTNYAGFGGRGEEREDERVFAAAGADDEEGARER
jgi:hypothetical protein